jgi:hypothetical protein
LPDEKDEKEAIIKALRVFYLEKIVEQYEKKGFTLEITANRNKVVVPNADNGAIQSFANSLIQDLIESKIELWKKNSLKEQA